MIVSSHGPTEEAVGDCTDIETTTHARIQSEVRHCND
jgi:hypothetical protein